MPQRRRDHHVMLVEAHPAGLQPVGFQQLVEKLRGPLAKVAQLSALVFIQLDVGMTHQCFANQRASVIVGQLSTFVRGLD